MLIPLLSGYIFLDRGIMKIETENREIFTVLKKNIVDSFPLVQGDQVRFKLDEKRNASEIMISSVVRGVCQRKGFFNIRKKEVPYPTNQKVQIGDVADLKLKEDKHFITISEIHPVPKEDYNDDYENRNEEIWER